MLTAKVARAKPQENGRQIVRVSGIIICTKRSARFTDRSVLLWSSSSEGMDGLFDRAPRELNPGPPSRGARNQEVRGRIHSTTPTDKLTIALYKVINAIAVSYETPKLTLSKSKTVTSITAMFCTTDSVGEGSRCAAVELGHRIIFQFGIPVPC